MQVIRECGQCDREHQSENGDEAQSGPQCRSGERCSHDRIPLPFPADMAAQSPWMMSAPDIRTSRLAIQRNHRREREYTGTDWYLGTSQMSYARAEWCGPEQYDGRFR